MSVKSYQYAFSAGETKQYRGGEYFTIEQLTDEVSVEIFSPRGTSLGKVENVGAGFWIKLDEENGNVGRVDVYSASAQTINIIVGSGEFGVNKTSTTITGGSLDPLTHGASYHRHNISNALDTIVTPAANVNGVVIISGYVFVYTSGFYVTRMMSKTSAPTGITDSAASTVLMDSSKVAGEGGGGGNVLPVQLIIPAGNGVYAQSSDSVNGSVVSLSYTIL